MEPSVWLEQNSLPSKVFFKHECVGQQFAVACSHFHEEAGTLLSGKTQCGDVLKTLSPTVFELPGEPAAGSPGRHSPADC